jgi:hypothetical protein
MSEKLSVVTTQLGDQRRVLVQPANWTRVSEIGETTIDFDIIDSVEVPQLDRKINDLEFQNKLLRERAAELIALLIPHGEHRGSHIDCEICRAIGRMQEYL